MTFLELAKVWFGSTEFMGLSARSRELYAREVRRLAPFHKKEVKEITRPVIVKWRDSLYDKPATCRLSIATMGSLFRFAMDHGHMVANPVSGLRGLPGSVPMERWEETHIKEFLEKAPPHLADAVALAFYTGQRISDLVKIKWEDVTDKYIYVHQQKTGRKLYIPLHKGLRPFLERREKVMKKMRRRIPTVIFNTNGDRWQTRTLTTAVSAENVRLGYRGKKFHGIRKTTASLLAEMGCTPSQIMAITGHSTLAEVTRYTAEAEQRRMAQQAMDRFDV